MTTKKEISEFMKKMGSRGGKKAADNMTKKQRVKRAKQAVAAREAKRGRK
jgi:hypothetical protein